MKIYIVATIGSRFHLFDSLEYAKRYSSEYEPSTILGPFEVNDSEDMRVVNSLFPWLVYKYYKDPNSIQDGSSYLYIYAKTYDHAEKLLDTHNHCADYYFDEIVDEIPGNTVLSDIINFAKEE